MNDMARYLIGHPKSVSANMGNVGHAQIRDYTVEDGGASVASFVNGAISTIITNCAVPGLWEGKFTAIFEKDTVFLIIQIMLVLPLLMILR
jgi:predicted dehydrogenase